MPAVEPLLRVEHLVTERVDATSLRERLAGEQFGCLREMLVIASFLGIQDPRERPADQRGTYLAFTHPGSAGMAHLRELAAAGLTLFGSLRRRY